MQEQPKRDLGGGVSHPARFSVALFPLFARLLMGYKRVLDPYAGTGGIHKLREYGYETYGVEIEPEWADLSSHTRVGNALDLVWSDGTFDAICTSPTYGNRLADHHKARDPEARRSYTHDLGRGLTIGNSGTLPWGHAYRVHHAAAWREATRVCLPRARFVLNIKDHYRSGEWQDVAAWHVRELCRLGWEVVAIRPVTTGGLTTGSTGKIRVPAELVIALDRRPEP